MSLIAASSRMRCRPWCNHLEPRCGAASHPTRTRACAKWPRAYCVVSRGDPALDRAGLPSAGRASRPRERVVAGGLERDARRDADTAARPARRGGRGDPGGFLVTERLRSAAAGSSPDALPASPSGSARPDQSVSVMPDVRLLPELLTVAETATVLRVGRSWVYQHAAELGGRSSSGAGRPRHCVSLVTACSGSSACPHRGKHADPCAPRGRGGQRQERASCARVRVCRSLNACLASRPGRSSSTPPAMGW
jgi:hypothetical protein